ncbi:hypothetical protein FOZ60_006887 [Perkinsus olseni]|uniref:DNA-directed DNA polymerase n=1 Tax=Perkinsus olseni TaxID=32597 RepID=A0A7J6NMM3_PEROL|nr:hypothetical protein FOZ60_006887 [Perkinsus olseni]
MIYDNAEEYSTGVSAVSSPIRSVCVELLNCWAWRQEGVFGSNDGHFAKFSTAVGDAQPAKDNSLLVQGVQPAENAASVETREDTSAVEKNGRGAAVGKQPRVHKRQNTGPLPLPPTLSALRELLAPTAAVWIDMENEPMIAELLATINGSADSLISLGVFNSDNTTNFRIPRHAELQRYAISAAFEDRFPKPLAFAILHQRGVLEVQERQVYVLPYCERTMDFLADILSCRRCDVQTPAFVFNIQETLRYFAIDRPSEMLYADVGDLAILAWVLDSAAGSACYDIDHLKTVYGEDSANKRAGEPATLQESHPWRMLVDHDLPESSDLITVLSGKVNAQDQTEVALQQELPVAPSVDSDVVTMAKLEREAQALVKKEILMTSPAQVAALLYDDLGLQPPAGRRSRSTGDEVLSMMVDQHPVVSIIRKHRQVAKLITTYVDTIRSLPESAPRPGLLEYFQPRSGVAAGCNFLGKNRLYTVWNQTMTVTGRLSSSNPNLQNIPRSHELEDLGVISLRKAFISPILDSHCLLSVDYRQVEIRVLAHFVGRGALRESFAVDGADIYTNMAAMILRKPAEEVTKPERNKAKVCCLALVYGSGIHLLARQMGVTTTVAQGFKRQFSYAFPELERWMFKVWRDANKDGYVETICKRRRRIDRDENGGLSSEAKRFCINSIIQGSAADIMKSAMVQIAHALDEVKWQHGRPQLLLSIHDEFVLSCHRDDVDRLGRLLLREMQNPALPGHDEGDRFSVPLEVSMKYGQNWADMKELSITLDGRTSAPQGVVQQLLWSNLRPLPERDPPPGLRHGRDLPEFEESSRVELQKYPRVTWWSSTALPTWTHQSSGTSPTSSTARLPAARGYFWPRDGFLESNPQSEFMVYLDDDSFLSIPRLIPHLLQLTGNEATMLVMGYLMSTPLDVTVSGIDICDICKPCSKCLDDQSLRDVCAQFNLALGALPALRIHVDYFGSRWTPTWPLGMGWVLGSEVTRFIARNAGVLKSRGAADVQIGYWLAGLEDVHWVDMSDGRFHDFPRRHSMFTRGCGNDSILIHRIRHDSWQSYNSHACTLDCPTEIDGEVEPS